MTTDNSRLLIHSSKWGTSKARLEALTRGSKRRRAQWPGYRPSQSGLSTPFVKKSSCNAKNSESPIKQGVLRHAPYLSHIPATFWTKENFETPGIETTSRAIEFRGLAIDSRHGAGSPVPHVAVLTGIRLDRVSALTRNLGARRPQAWSRTAQRAPCITLNRLKLIAIIVMGRCGPSSSGFWTRTGDACAIDVADAGSHFGPHCFGPWRGGHRSTWAI